MIHTLQSPAEYERLPSRDLSGTTCVVFDILRATTTIVTALANGAERIVPVMDIPQALAEFHRRPGALLAGERGGLRITAAQSGGVDFHLGNSPREFTPEMVAGKTIITTTTNGTRALRACASAKAIFPAAFLNLQATAGAVCAEGCEEILLVCAGTGEEAAWEDTLAAGAMAEALLRLAPGHEASDATFEAMTMWDTHRAALAPALGLGTNGRRLLAMPELRADVAVCAALDTIHRAARQSKEGEIRFQ